MADTPDSRLQAPCRDVTTNPVWAHAGCASDIDWVAGRVTDHLIELGCEVIVREAALEDVTPWDTGFRDRSEHYSLLNWQAIGWSARVGLSDSFRSLAARCCVDASTSARLKEKLSKSTTSGFERLRERRGHDP